MKLSDALEAAFNDQIQAELASAYLYLSMSAHFEGESLPGFAHWMREQAQEEVSHAMRIYRHVLDRDGRVALQAIEKPSSHFASPLDAFEQALDHERSMSERFHRLYKMAIEEEDFAALPLIEWFVSEQVEEESLVGGVVDQLRMVGDAGHALLLLDRDLGRREGDPAV